MLLYWYRGESCNTHRHTCWDVHCGGLTAPMLSCTSVSSAEVFLLECCHCHHGQAASSFILCLTTRLVYDDWQFISSSHTCTVCSLWYTSSAVLWTSPILTSAETSPRYTVYVCVCIYRNHDQYRYHMPLSHTSLNHLWLFIWNFAGAVIITWSTRALVHHVIKPPIDTSRDTRVFGAISNSRISEEEDHALLLRLVRWFWLLVAAWRALCCYQMTRTSLCDLGV